MAGLIHIYCGEGKGKTTASVGLAVRAAGAGKKVIFAQFFKDGSSSEIRSLEKLPNITPMHCHTVPKLFFRMTDEEKQQARKDYTAHLERVLEAAAGADLLVLDEIISACNHGTVPPERVESFLRQKPEHLEVVLTGREPAGVFVELADYVTEMRKIKHPFDRGIHARKGVEF